MLRVAAIAAVVALGATACTPVDDGVGAADPEDAETLEAVMEERNELVSHADQLAAELDAVTRDRRDEVVRLEREIAALEEVVVALEDEGEALREEAAQLRESLAVAAAEPACRLPDPVAAERAGVETVRAYLDRDPTADERERLRERLMALAERACEEAIDVEARFLVWFEDEYSGEILRLGRRESSAEQAELFRRNSEISTEVMAGD